MAIHEISCRRYLFAKLKAAINALPFAAGACSAIITTTMLSCECAQSAWMQLKCVGQHSKLTPCSRDSSLHDAVTLHNIELVSLCIASSRVRARQRRTATDQLYQALLHCNPPIACVQGKPFDLARRRSAHRTCQTCRPGELVQHVLHPPVVRAGLVWFG